MREKYDIGLCGDWFDGSIKKHGDFVENEITDFICKTYKENWITSYDYSKTKLKEYKGNITPNEFIYNADFLMCITYISELEENLSKFDFSNLDIVRKNEIMKYEDNGGNCIYMSVLLAMLLVENKVFNKHEIKLIQGMYEFNQREDFPEIYNVFGKIHRGLHCFLIVRNKYILDMTLIPQQNRFFDFKGLPVITGEVPEGIKLVGYEEKYNVIERYIQDILDINNTTYDSWVDLHKVCSTKNFLDEINDYLDEIGERIK